MTVRTRFAPAPSGDLHVGNVRTALFSWALARQAEGTFVLRVEDTDASRATEEAFAGVQDALRWIGIDWDEGPGVGGPYAPYRQSERRAVYDEAAARLEAGGAAYRCYCTPEEIAERRAGSKRPPGYDGHCRRLSDTQRAAYEADGRSHILRFPMPPGATTWTDLVLGEVTIAHDQIPDFALTRSGGAPLYVLAAAVDDALMKLTHIVRGNDLVSATPRQMALFAALGHPREEWPSYGHLPLIVGEDGKPLSKRNGEVSLRWYREHGFLADAMRNYLALLGWSLAPDRELFDTAEMVAAFDLSRVSRNPARFDVRKLEAINGEKIRALPEETLVQMLRPWFEAAGVPLPPGVLESAVPLIQTRIVRLTDAVDMLRFLLVEEADFAVVDDDQLVPAVAPQLSAAREALAAVEAWTHEVIERTLRDTLVDGLGLKPKLAFGPVRVAVTGRRMSPPLFESLELLGRDRSLGRLDAALALAAEA
ncbi:MAG TPA: glutamate--tRNA ligase [Mycobacteriales bacterium]